MKKRMSIVLLLALLLQIAAPSVAAAESDEAGIRPMSLFEEFTIDGVRYSEITDRVGVNEVMVSGAADGATVVNIPAEVTNPATNETFRVTALRGSAFSEHKTLTSVTLPDSITEISEGAFEEAAALKSVTVSDNVTRFADSAFRHCKALTKVNFPSKLQSIGYAVFSNTALGGDIDLTHCRQLTSIGQSAFGFSEVNLESVAAPPITSLIMPNSVTEIGARCFAEAYPSKNTLKKVVLSENITVLPDKVFSDCSQLTDLTLPPNLTSVGENAFLNCSSLPTLSLPNSVTAIGNGAFRGCALLTGFTWPSGATVVPSNAFSSCTKLASIALPEGVTEIGASAFEGCLAMIEIGLPSTVTSVGKSSFESCAALTKINLQNTKITNLPQDVFRDCKVLTSVNQLELPDTLATLESGAFSNIDTSLHINTTVEDMAKKLNRDKSRLAPNMSQSSFNVYLSGTPYITAADPEPARPHQPFFTTEPTGGGTNPQENYYYTPLTADTAMARYESGSVGDDSTHTVTIPEYVTNPDTMERYRVVKLDRIATKSANIVLPASITEYGDVAFSSCKQLESFVMNDSVTKIGWGIFQRLPKLKTVTLSSNLAEIPMYTFEACTALEEVIVPASVQSIGVGAFYKSGIKTLTIPDTVKTLDGGIAKNCLELETVSMGSGVTVIPAQAFYNTPKLTSLTLPKNLEVIADQAFPFTPMLTHVSLPKMVTQISSHAFYKSGLTRTKLPANAKVDVWAFDKGALFVESEAQLQAIAAVGPTKSETYHTIVDKVSIDKPASQIINTGKLTATVEGTYSQDVASVDWSSSDSTIATIDRKTGEVTVLKDGDVTFTATSRYGKTLTTNASGVITAAVPAADSVKIAVVVQEPGGGGGGDTYYTVTFRAGENGTLSGPQTYQVRGGGKLTAVPSVAPNKGFVFLGWSTDGKTTVDPLDASVHKSTTYTALYRPQNPGDLLNRDDHTVPFIQGDDHGLFRPTAAITRGEVATIFSRLLTDKTAAPAAPYSDVARDAWYAQAVDKLAQIGVLTGYADGTFRPEQPISRSEFAAIVARFGTQMKWDTRFPDVEESHWAYVQIQSAAAHGWAKGYPDGTFRPEQDIARSEAVVMLCRILNRQPDRAYIDQNLSSLRVFPDVDPSYWAFYEIMEASNGHKHFREDGTERWN